MLLENNNVVSKHLVDIKQDSNELSCIKLLEGKSKYTLTLKYRWIL